MQIEENEKQANEAAFSTGDFDGKWERKDRSLNAAAIFGLLGIGVLYFNAQSVLAAISISISALSQPEVEFTGHFFEQLNLVIKQFSMQLLAAVVISQYLFMLLPTWLLVRSWHTSNIKAYVRLTSVRFGEILLSIIATLAIIPTGTFISNALVQWLGIPKEFFEMTLALFTAKSNSEFIFLVFAIAITPAICEEIFFRGYVQRTFERTIQWKSVLLVGVIFGLFHMQPLGLITLSMLGILFGYFYYRSKSIYPSIAAHFINNFLVILILFKSPAIGETNLATASQIPITWVLVTLPVALLALIVYHNVTEKEYQRQNAYEKNN